MKTIIRLPIPSQAKVLVEIGDKISLKTCLVEADLRSGEEIIPLASLLHISPSRIPQYLKKAIGEEVQNGDLLAEKRSLFISSAVKSPLKGKIKEIDLKMGTLTLVYTDLSGITEKRRRISSPVAGKISAIDKNGIDIEVEGHVLRAIKGEGEEVTGDLDYISGSETDIFDIDSEVNEKIVFCRGLPEEGVVKLEVLGAAGCIIQKAGNNLSLPWVEVNEEVAKKLGSYQGKKIWLRPKEKEIVVLE